MMVSNNGTHCRLHPPAPVRGLVLDNTVGPWDTWSTAVHARGPLRRVPQASDTEHYHSRCQRIGVRKLFATRRIVLAGGGRRTIVITLPPRFADLDPGTPARCALRLVAPGRHHIERTVEPSMP